MFLYYFVRSHNTETSIFFFACFLALTVRSLWFYLTPKQLPAAALWSMDLARTNLPVSVPGPYLSIEELCFKRKFRPKPEDLSIAQRTNASGYFRGTF